MQFLLKSKKSLQIENEFMCEKMWKTANHIPGKKSKEIILRTPIIPNILKHIYIFGACKDLVGTLLNFFCF